MWILIFTAPPPSPNSWATVVNRDFCHSGVCRRALASSTRPARSSAAPAQLRDTVSHNGSCCVNYARPRHSPPTPFVLLVCLGRRACRETQLKAIRRTLAILIWKSEWTREADVAMRLLIVSLPCLHFSGSLQVASLSATPVTSCHRPLLRNVTWSQFACGVSPALRSSRSVWVGASVFFFFVGSTLKQFG